MVFIIFHNDKRLMQIGSGLDNDMSVCPSGHRHDNAKNSVQLKYEI